MDLRRKLFAEKPKEEEAEKKVDRVNKEEDPEYVADRAIVSGTTTSLIGVGGHFGKKYLLKNDKKRKVLNSKDLKKLGALSKVLIPTGLVIAAAGGYKKYKNKKSKKNEDKA